MTYRSVTGVQQLDCGLLDDATPRQIAVVDSELGWMAVGWVSTRVARLSFAHGSPQAACAALDWPEIQPTNPTAVMQRTLERLRKYAAGQVDDFLDIPLHLPDLTSFQQAVIDGCRRIAYGHTLSYGQLASRAGYPRAARAVGNVMRTNRIPLIIPCHRVVGSAGSLGGYSAPQGLAMKRRLLALESAQRLSPTL